MYQGQLLDAYKKAQNYIQDKQIAHDLNVHPSRICEMRKGSRYISDSEAVFLAENAGIPPELALLGIHADRNENVTIKAMWERIAKKFNKQGLQRLSMGYGAIVMGYGVIQQSINECALYVLC
ncbi:DUF3693 domain-containing protein [Vibrio sp. A1-b2]|uniref:DUF3693 domain-containing protein n=1 Tax=Vibrio sp. A1-b2 TaxID=2912248 RepID=UPI001F3C9E7A|nr:DUF3693 domain-containing protein [Vibrio sp. A1-b2]MCF7363890.1 DUF3693 domain-containing protein [Vibrio sp. A1-b2]